MLIVLDRLIELVGGVQRIAEIEVGLGVVGLDAQRQAQMPDGGSRFVTRDGDGCVVAVSVGVTGPGLHGPVEMREGLVRVTLRLEHEPKVMMGLVPLGAQPDGLPVVIGRFVQLVE